MNSIGYIYNGHTHFNLYRRSSGGDSHDDDSHGDSHDVHHGDPYGNHGHGYILQVGNWTAFRKKNLLLPAYLVIAYLVRLYYLLVCFIEFSILIWNKNYFIGKWTLYHLGLERSKMYFDRCYIFTSTKYGWNHAADNALDLISAKRIYRILKRIT